MNKQNGKDYSDSRNRNRTPLPGACREYSRWNSILKKPPTLLTEIQIAVAVWMADVPEAAKLLKGMPVEAISKETPWQ